MSNHISAEGEPVQLRAQLEDFVATCPEVYIAHENELWACTAEQRGGAIWLYPKQSTPLDDAGELQLCCPHATGLYRFRIDVLEIADDRIIATRSVHDPMGRRISLRGKSAVPVTLHPAGIPDVDPVAGRTADISRGGMLLTCEEPLPLDSEWECEMNLRGDETVVLRARVVRVVSDDGTNRPTAFGLEFQEVSVEDQRVLVDFVLANADLSAEGGAPRSAQ